MTETAGPTGRKQGLWAPRGRCHEA